MYDNETLQVKAFGLVMFIKTILKAENDTMFLTKMVESEDPRHNNCEGG